MRDLRPRTREAYVSYPVLLGRHYQTDPATLDEERVRSYFLFLRQERRYAGSSLSLALAALRCFYCEHLGTGVRWKLWREMRVRRAQTLPVVLSREEVARLFQAVRCDRFRTVLRLIYGCGLRINEAVRLEVTDIDGAAGRVHLREAKGGKDRYVPIAPALVATLRRFWRRHRHPRWLFPGLRHDWKTARTPLPERARAATSPMSASAVQGVWRSAWVVHLQPAGRGQQVLEYLSRYIFRTAISSARLLSQDERQVCFTYLDSDTRQQRTLTLSGEEFLRRFLQHVLPRGFHRVRSYGWLSAAAKDSFERLCALLDALAVSPRKSPSRPPVLCARCHCPMQRIAEFSRGPP